MIFQKKFNFFYLKTIFSLGLPFFFSQMQIWFEFNKTAAHILEILAYRAEFALRTLFSFIFQK